MNGVKETVSVDFNEGLAVVIINMPADKMELFKNGYCFTYFSFFLLSQIVTLNINRPYSVFLNTLTGV